MGPLTKLKVSDTLDEIKSDIRDIKTELEYNKERMDLLLEMVQELLPKRSKEKWQHNQPQLHSVSPKT